MRITAGYVANRRFWHGSRIENGHWVSGRCHRIMTFAYWVRLRRVYADSYYCV